VFLDVAALRSGQNWAERLERELASRDAFYLFWSNHAKSWEWVERAWKTALRPRGIEYIDPIPPVDSQFAPPPAELSGTLHFNDWVLAYLRRCSVAATN